MKALIVGLCLSLSTQVMAQTKAVGVTLMIEDTIMDGTAIYFNNNSDGIDLNDAIDLSVATENLAISRYNQLLGIEQRRTYATTDLYLWNLRDLRYKLRLSKLNLPRAVALEDKLLNTITYFQDTAVNYIFYTDTDVVCNRFRLIFPSVLGINDTPVIRPEVGEVSFSIYPVPSPDYLFIKGLDAGRYDVTIYSLQRKLTLVVTSDGLHPVRVQHNLPRGVYYVNVNNIVKTILIK